MSEMILVRHGQAAAFTADSDRLTELGHRQARILGEYWVGRGEAFDQVLCGSLRRHRETYAAVRAAYLAAARDFPEAEEDAGWDEYDAGAILGLLGSALRERDAGFAKLSDDAAEHASGPERNRYFQRAFEVLMDTWVGGQLTVDGVEPFAAFHARVMDARARVLSQAGSRRVLVFTSGGPIGVNVQATLEAPVAHAMRVNWRVRNASLTEFLFSRQRISFDSFNRVPHLESQPDLVSFR